MTKDKIQLAEINITFIWKRENYICCNELSI